MRRPLLAAVPAGFALAAALTVTLAAPASAGPPWIAIEYPANPHHPSTRGAALLVRAYHHSTAVAVPVRGTAEGIVDGRRVTRRLDIRATSTPGVFALRSELPSEGAWVLALTVEQGSDVTATALVRLDGRGGIASVEVPSRESRDGWTVPRAVERSDIDRLLRASVAAADQNRTAPASASALAGLLGLPLLLAAAARRRRRAHA